jgi:glycosyltransferase involved in cell wall biosynthesis
MTRRWRIACLVTHPIQYQAPLFHHLAADPALELEVFFLSRLSVKDYYDPGFRARVQWDTPLLEGYRHTFLPCVGASDQLSFWRPLNYGLRKKLAAGRFDALWVHGYAHQGLLRGIAAARSLGLKILLRGDSQLNDSGRGAAALAIKRIVLPRLLRLIDGAMAIGTRNREYYRYYGVPNERIFTMPHAVDNDYFAAAAARARPDRERLRAELGLPAGRPVILFAAKLQDYKRPDDLLEAFIRLASRPQREPDACLLFAGEGERGAALKARAAALNLSGVRFLGFKNQSELPALYDLCDIFVLPSARDAWGLAVNEVMNAGKPVIVSARVGAAADLVADGVNGFVVPAFDVAALGDRLARLLADGALRARMGAQSLRRIRDFSFQADRAGLVEALAAVTAKRADLVRTPLFDIQCE